MAFRIQTYTGFRYLCILLLFFLQLCRPGLSIAQPPSIPEKTQETLRQYVHFSNELMHALHLMRSDFESINWQLLEYSEGLKEEPFYRYEPIFSNADYFPIDVDTLFRRLFLDNRHLPPRLRGKPFQLAGKMHQVTKQLRVLLNDFNRYFEQKAYKVDKQLEEALGKLKRAEILYYDLAILRDKLSWSLQEVREAYAYNEDYVYFPILTRLDACLSPIEKALRQLRRDSITPDALILDARKQLRALELASAELLAPIPLMEELYSPHKILPRFIKGSEHLLETIVAPLRRPAAPTKRLQASQPAASYYHYNRVLLPLYNRYNSGLTALYNNLLRFSDAQLLPAFEIAPSFELWESYALAQEKEDSLDVDAIVAEALRKDSLKRAKQQGPSLKGFAANHLIFLLDVSFSMNAPEKMPLLKIAFNELLDVMRPEDQVSIIVYSGEAEVLLPPTSAGSYRDSIRRVINRLEPRHSSDADAGIELAYELAQAEANYIPNGNNRIILATDGNLVLKRKSQRLIEKGADEGIKLSVFYFDDEEVFQIKQVLMALAELGMGNYAHIQAENAKKSLLLEAQGKN